MEKLKKHIVVDGLDIAYVECGSGPLVLMLHGWGDSLTTFDQLINEWGVNHRFVTLDLPGFGSSQRPKNIWDVSNYSIFIQKFLDKLSMGQPVIIVGHSLGGRIAIKGVSVGHFEPKHLVLISSAGTAESRSVRNVIFMIVAKVGKIIAVIPPFSFFKKLLKKLLYGAAGSLDYLHAGSMKETFLKIIHENLTEDARKISTPTLLIWGESDDVTPITEAHALHSAIDGSKLVVVPSVGHFVHQEKARNVVEEILRFTNI